jgi:hypothetical protein
MDDRIMAALGLLTILVIFLCLFSGIASRYELEQAYTQYIDTPAVRNEWGQLPASKERMCAATIQQWSEWCK